MNDALKKPGEDVTERVRERADDYGVRGIRSLKELGRALRRMKYSVDTDGRSTITSREQLPGR